MLINGQWVLGRARKLAERVSKTGSADLKSVVQHTYQIAFGRRPRREEVETALAFFEQQRQRIKAAPLVHANDRDNRAIAKVLLANQRSNSAAEVNVNKKQYLETKATDAFRFNEFTIEAVIYLDSLAEDAKVRVIASHWDGNAKHRGWSFGVTSKKSKHQPRNLILQLVGDTKSSKSTSYEVIASNLRPQLHRLYHVAASVKLVDTGKAGVTFHLRDLESDTPVQTATVAHKVVGNLFNNAAFLIGFCVFFLKIGRASCRERV